MAEIQLRDVQKHFGPVHVIRDMNLTVADREFVVLLGPSGCGKTTTLRAIAGLESIDSGDILIDGKPVQNLHASDRDIAFVFQLYALYPHLTVYENIAFPLRATGQSKAEVDKAVRTVAGAIGIIHLLKLRPSALSGGDMQRVAIGRALVRRPKALLMDEPIGSLDAKLREGMRVELKRLHLENGSTSIYVTHDQVEAMSLADRIVIMHDGILQQVGTPSEVYLRPANLFVAQFIGSPVMNVTEAKVTENAGETGLQIASENFAMPRELLGMLQQQGAESISLGVRPEGVLLSHDQQPGYRPVEAHLIQPFGPFDIVDLNVGGQTLRARTHTGFVRQPGEKLWARIDPAQAHFFDQKSGTSLGIRLT
ncbi:MAG: transporter ATP-binding protein [Devosia sp.]|uniref:ABC transporter ATP-binding protein n=1 Tax=Devosia sp. TaxID=1871048 RepID=UPI002616E952|nr:ABC transporter ATP-binding protein [Devosia sp.]MDB5541471.1 transporter ATP-binding protein [Devosia sp.]